MKSRRIPLGPVPVPPPANIEITMTETEAETLLAVTNRIGGAPHNTRRKHTDALTRALKEAGISIPQDSIGLSEARKWVSEHHHAIHFVNGSLPEDETMSSQRYDAQMLVEEVKK